MEIEPIAFFKTRKKRPYEAARQGAVDSSSEIAEIHFQPKRQFEQALDGLEGFTHLWLIYHFHTNKDWKPKVLPPRGSEQKVGVFATRSPYRPNSLGLSCVELVERQGLVLKVRNFDLLDETPIFDVKPYLSYADSFPEASLGWLSQIENEAFKVSFSSKAIQQLEFLESSGLEELRNFIQQQLRFDPFNSRKKRVKRRTENEGLLAYRTWRIHFHFSGQEIEILSLFSGYTEKDWSETSDPYGDKNLHREFLQRFPTQ